MHRIRDRINEVALEDFAYLNEKFTQEAMNAYRPVDSNIKAAYCYLPAFVAFYVERKWQEYVILN